MLKGIKQVLPACMRMLKVTKHQQVVAERMLKVTQLVLQVMILTLKVGLQ
jgi:hypothetical protein